MYHDFFGLKEAAFSIAVNPRYLYMSNQHREALAHLLYGIQNGGFVMLTGEVGTGKTTIIRCLLEQLPDNTDIAIILNPMSNAPELLSTICDELGASYIEDDVGLKELTDSLNHFLLQNHRKGRRTVLLIDEAQLLDVQVLEQIRLLTNLETTTEKLLQIILVGQPELKELLARPALRQLSQRITARFHLEALNLAETQAYIAHRLSIAGMPEHLRPFDDEMIKRIHQFSGGIPRLINILSERLLLGAYAKAAHRIDNDIFQQAVYEVSGTNATQSSISIAEQWPVKVNIRWPVNVQWTNYIHAMLVGLLLVIIAMVWQLVPAPEGTVKSELIAAVASEAVEPPNKEAVSGIAVAAPTTTTTAASATDLPAVNVAAAELDVIKFTTRDMGVARAALANYLGIPAIDTTNVCTAMEGQTYRCEKTNINSWDELKDINRPAVLTLVTPSKKWVYAVMIGLSESHVLLLANGKQMTAAWTDISPLWNGDLLYLWSRPDGFEKAIEMGDQGDQVTWLAEQFARLDKQPAPLTRHFFTDKLKKRVELFQTSQKIVPDGVVGSQTLRRLNEALGVDKVLLDLNAQQGSDANMVKGL